MKPSNIFLSEEDNLIILDQTKLPNEEVYIQLDDVDQMYDAIFHLKVRGAPAIGICAGYSMYILGKNYNFENMDEFKEQFLKDSDYLNSSRPTAVNLSWALNRMNELVENFDKDNIKELVERLRDEAIKIQEEDILMCKSISEHGLSLLEDGMGLLTHCNAGPMATSLYGTALGPMILGRQRGYNFHVFVDETRPLLQGARLTSYELDKEGIDTTLICDNMASIVMKSGKVQAVLVGCDRIAANGDVANKIGTSGVAVLAKYYGIPFYVLGPTSTLDLDCKSGEEITIELRPEDEIRSKWYEKPMAPKGVKAYNPAFDVTDHSLITAIITEKGICRPPYEESLQEIMKK
ncbi:S-methyl-5-thioribose-1-phosphate isomerase [Lagierella sp.]|uniref:S-methyl-5-thioribose-1-phosphate isomerase n=1 Tax=Lagierella sp. TaxID=2849657 RepID=UPI002602BC46|nr:S-methyl-5-thioribose-1-phosphate isomerase [Lagierella sp.]